MAVVIRMKRTGRRNRPCYRISVADKYLPRDGRTIETLGFYDPASPVEELRVSLNVERARHWLEHGALPSPTVHSIFKRQGVWEGGIPVKKKRDRSGRKKTTAKKERRSARDASFAEKKVERRTEREKARAAAAAAAKSAESDSKES